MAVRLRGKEDAWVRFPASAPSPKAAAALESVVLCRSCKKGKPEEEFAWRNKARGERQRYCKECKKVYNAAWYATHKDEQVARVAVRGAEWRRMASDIIAWYKDQPCTDCKRRYPPYVMDFDHRDGNTKVNNVAGMRGWPLKKLVAEIEKCDVVCSNCHRIRTHLRLHGVVDSTPAP